MDRGERRVLEGSIAKYITADLKEIYRRERIRSGSF